VGWEGVGQLALGMYYIARRVCVLSGVDLPQNSASICASSFVDKFIFKKRKWTVEVDGGGRNTAQNAHSDGQTATNPIRIV
tara:strand:- start:125 stop:367 length:243 start_codon:yes stop_codon:yes gene_type:complete